jgi:hypothetical protein
MAFISELSTFYQRTTGMEADTYREAVKTGEEASACRSIYGNQ